MSKYKILSLCGFLALCYSIAILGGFATHESLSPWYAHLKKGAWNPPAWVFGPVWMILYFMIAVAGWLIFISKRSALRNRALVCYSLQLFFKFLLSFLFFYFQSPYLGLVDLLLLLIFLFLTLKAAWGLSRRAAYLLLPYFLWSLYALTLNAAIYYLNF
jgi:tryptophan-rich sensory protein